MSDEYEWIKLGTNKEQKGVYFQKRELYELYESDWRKDKVDLRNSLIRGCKFGGPIAVTMDPRRRKYLLGSGGAKEQIISLYTPSGRRMSSFLWNEDDFGRLVTYGFSRRETLFCVSSEWVVYIYDLFGRLLKKVKMKEDVVEEGVVGIDVFSGGIILVTRVNRVHILSRFHTKSVHYGLPSCRFEVNFELVKNPFDDVQIEVVEHFNEGNEGRDGDLDVYVVVRGHSFVSRISTHMPPENPVFEHKFERFSVSPNGQILSFYTSLHELWITKSSFVEHLKEPFRIRVRRGLDNAFPEEMIWCGNDCVCLYWSPKQRSDGEKKSVLMLIGPTKVTKTFEYEGSLFFVGEMDGLRVISADSYELVQRVPRENQTIFRIGSLESAALLYDSYLEFQKKQASSIKNIKRIQKKNELKKAVLYCIRAAGNEFDPKQQNKLLKAGSYGKSFLSSTVVSSAPLVEDVNDEDVLDDVGDEEEEVVEGGDFHGEFVRMCKELRVLNSVRHGDVGVPLSYEEYVFLGERNLIERLCLRHEHLLAFRVCEYLNLEEVKKSVLIHWACSKVRSEEGSREILSAIEKKCLKENVNFSKIASAAFRCGKKDLATRLLEHEEYPGEQVDLLLEMDTTEDLKKALHKSIESGEMDLIHLVLFTMKNRLYSYKGFVQMLFSDPYLGMARKFYLSFCEEEGSKDSMKLLKLCYQINEPQLHFEQGLLSLKQCMKSSNEQQSPERTGQQMEEAKSFFEKSKKFPSNVEKSYCEVQKKLWEIEKELDGKEKIYQKDDDDDEDEEEGGRKKRAAVFYGSSLAELMEKIVLHDINGDGIQFAKNLRNKHFKKVLTFDHWWWIVVRALMKSNEWKMLQDFMLQNNYRKILSYQQNEKRFRLLARKYNKSDFLDLLSKTRQ